MDPITQQTVLAAAGAGGGDPVYVDDVFSTFLYDGTDAAQSINNGIDLAGKGGMVWIKNRTGAFNNHITDTVRGVNNLLVTNETSANQSGVSYCVNAFNSNGFGVTSSDVWNNSSSYDYASWSFRKAPGFFDVVTWTGNSVAGRTISHTLGSTPGMVIVKSTSNTENWTVWHRSISNTQALWLQSIDDVYNQSTINIWNSTTPTSTEFTLGNWEGVNQNGYTYVAYIFAHDDAQFGTDEDESIIKCGSYTTDGSGNATVDLGFEPQWILSKRVNSSGSWYIRDVMRGMPVDGDNKFLYAESSAAESASSFALRPSSSGFTAFNDSASQTNVYMAIRRPHKPPEAGTDVFKALHRTGTGADSSVTGFGFSPDLVIAKRTDNSGSAEVFDKIRAPGSGLKTAFSMAEARHGGSYPTVDLVSFDNDGLSFGAGLFYEINYTSRDIAIYNFRRAPGFFDVVAYTGDGVSNRTVPSNLGVAAELAIVKRRDSTGGWLTYSKDIPSSDYLFLNATQAPGTYPFFGTQTAAGLVLNNAAGASLNGSGGDYIAYLFATLPGISKVGSYTGTGSPINVDCGFTSGARFIIIKRTDAASGWHVWDTVRGIVAGNDPYLRLENTGAQTTSTDHVDPLNAGFIVNANDADVNTSGGTYIFLAIA